MSFDKKKIENTADLYAFLEADDNNIMETPKKISSREKKLKQLSGKFGELSSQAQNGFLMGAAVGGSMGALLGFWGAIQTKRLIILPISIITSGGFFGFMMMCGSIIRSDTENIYKQQQSTLSSNSYDQTRIDTYGANAFWKIKYAAKESDV